jgi:hypothetical protein
MDERKKFVKWSESFGISRGTATKLVKHMPADGALDPTLPNWICSPTYAMAANDPTQGGLGIEAQLHDEGFLVVGSCPNGDPVLVRFRDAKLPVYYLSHEQLVDKPLSQIMRKVSDSIAAYDKQLSNKKSEVARDYWDRSSG